MSGRGRGCCACWRCCDGLGVLAAEEPAPASSPIDLLLSSFERYLVSERGLAAGTIVGYLAHARVVRGRAGVGAGWSGCQRGEVTAAVLRKSASGRVGQRRAELRVGVASVSAVLLSSRGWSGLISRRRRWWSGVGGRHCCRAGSAGPTLARCWIPVIVAARSGGVTTR